MKEEYAVLRLHKGAVQYYGVDINLWGSFDRLDNIMNVFVSAVHSVSDGDSSLATLSSGIFGVSTWKVDEIGRGPRRTINCGFNSNDIVDNGETVDKEHGVESTEDAMDVLLEEYFIFVPKNPATLLLVVCGKLCDINDDSQTQSPQQQSCHTFELLQDKDTDVVVIIQEIFGPQLCVADDAEGDGSTTDNKFVENTDAQRCAWEQDAKCILEDKILALNEDDKDEPKMKIDAIIVNPIMPYAMRQILIRLFNN